MSRKRTPEEPTAETTTAVAEPAAAEAVPEGRSFAERVGQKKWQAAPDPFGIAKDNVVGVSLFESKQDRQMAIKFEEKPSQAIIDRMKEAAYRWDPSNKIWARPVRGDSAVATRIDAEKLYQELRRMIREEKGIELAAEASPEVSF